MNNIFNLNRFLLLFKKHTIEHGKTYLLSIAVLTGIIALILGFVAYSNGGRLAVQLQALMFIYFIAFAGSIFTSLSFTELGDKRKATGVLTLPASHFEKYLVSWLYSYIIFQLVFLGVFYTVDWVVISVSEPPAGYSNQLINVFDMDQQATVGFLLYALLHAFNIWGAIFFEKMHFIKTAFVFFIYYIAILLINNPFIRLITGVKGLESVAFGRLFIPGKEYYRVIPTDSMDNTNLVVLAIIVIIFWISAFYRLKEKEI